MRLSLVGITLAALALAGTSPTAQVPRARCVPTAPMPAASAVTRDRMPIVGADTLRLERMPVALLIPCYLADTTRRQLLP